MTALIIYEYTNISIHVNKQIFRFGHIYLDIENEPLIIQ